MTTLRGRGSGTLATAPTSAVAKRYPLTPMQQGMLFETVTQHAPWANLQQVVCRLNEPLDVSRLRNAWHRAQQDHGVLRSAFRWQQVPEPVQEVQSRVPIPFMTEDWSEVDPVRQEQDLQLWLNDDRAEGIALHQAPCMRLALFRLGPEQWVLVWTFHHALLDGRGFTLVLEEVFGHYDEAEQEPGETGSANFGDHARWVVERDTQAERQYFRQLLEGFDQPTTLPIASAPAANARPHVEVVGYLDEAVVQKLEALAAETDSTLYTCVLAGWALLLAKYSRRNDVVFGSTRSGRHTVAGADRIPGCFINTVATRVEVDPDASVESLLRAIRRDQVAVRPHEQTALVDAQACSDVDGATALLTTNVVFERHLMNDELRSKGGPWQHREFEVLEQGGFPLSLAAYAGDGLRLCVEFDPLIYDPGHIEPLLGHLRELLSQLSRADPTTAVASLTMLTEAEYSGFTATRPRDLKTSADQPYVDQFEQAVAKSPGATALGSIDGPGATYAELNHQANQLAHLLVGLGVAADSLVGLFLPRSREFSAAILGVGKAQGAYVPLDPELPPAVVAQMLDDCGAEIIVTTSDLAEALPPTTVEILLIDTDPRISAQPIHPPERLELTSEHLAYVIYTSGSTGTPKGVMVSHRSLTSHASAFAALTGLNATDRVLQFASMSFDVSVEQLIPTWLEGACVVLRNDQTASSVTAFLEQVECEQLTVLNLPTTFWSELVQHMDRDGATLPNCVRLVVVGGEEVPATVYNTWARLAPEVRWLNGYGPTECTITCTTHEPGGQELDAHAASVPIGRPTDNALAYVCDDLGQLVPVGVPGELWIGGPCVANGYLGRDDLTNERFHADPFTNTSGSRVYRTGDLARWLPSGALEFLGRIDDQIKLRGFRIEPRQIETAAERHPSVAAAVVAIREAGSGEPALVLWVTAAQSTPFDSDSLRTHLHAELPSHMRPNTTVVVDAIPTTIRGKTDVSALPDPHRPSPSESWAPRPEPRDELDLTIMSLMAEVLGTEDLRFDASFFDSGGHSLLAVRLLDQVENVAGQRVTLPTLHGAPTPYALADVLRQSNVENQFEYLVPIQPSGSKPPIFGVHVLGRNGSFFRPLAERLGPDQPVYGLGVGLVTAENASSPTGVEEIATAYAREIQLSAPEGPIILAAVSLGSVVAMELARQLTASGRELRLLALFDARGPGEHSAVPPRERVAIHARRLRAEGTAYLRGRVRDRWGSITEQAGLARAKLHEAIGLELPDKLRIARFIDDNSTAQLAYRMLPYHGRVAIFCAEEEIFDDPEFRTNGLGWSEIARGDFDVLQVPGAHLTMLTEPHVEVLATKLAALVEVSTTGSPDHQRGRT